MKFLKYIFLFLYTGALVVGSAQDTRCFKSVKGKSKVLFTVNDDWKGGYVKYCNQKDSIPVKHLSTKSLEDYDGRPSLFEHKFAEYYNGKLNGWYILQSQGAVVYGFKYKRKKDNRIIEFENEYNLDDNGNCVCN